MGKILKINNVLKKREQKIETNRVYQGDNLQIMKEMQGGKIDLIYIDPPFCAQNVFKSKAWGKKTVSFNDEWGGGVQSYIRWLVPRLRECHRLLSDTGVFCLHLDYRSVHYAKIELDKIFGEKNFVNEIVWCYQGCGQSKKHFKRKHDTILVYSKTKNYTFNWKEVGIPIGEKQKKKYTGKDKKGIYKSYKHQDGKVYKKYFNPKEVMPQIDWWSDVSIIQSFKERLGYPTQKPLALLDRLIKAFTNKNDLVFDAFCGCGTTVSSAQNLGRRWLGIDISKDAISVIKKRMLKEHKLRVEVIDANDLTAKQILNLNPFEFEKKMVELLGGTPNIKQVADGGVDGRAYDFTPIQVKKSYAVGRPVLDSFYKHIRNGNGKGIIVAHSFCKTMREEASRLYNKEGLEVILIETRDILRDMVEDKKAA